MFQTISRKNSGWDSSAYIQQTVQAAGSAEEPFSKYEKNYEKPVHFRRRNVRTGTIQINLWTTLTWLLSE